MRKKGNNIIEFAVALAVAVGLVVVSIGAFGDNLTTVAQNSNVQNINTINRVITQDLNTNTLEIAPKHNTGATYSNFGGGGDLEVVQTVASQGSLREKILENLEKLFGSDNGLIPENAYTLLQDKYINDVMSLYEMQLIYLDSEDKYKNVVEVIKTKINGTEYFISFAIKDNGEKIAVFTYLDGRIFKSILGKPDVMYTYDSHPNLYWLSGFVLETDYSKLKPLNNLIVEVLIRDDVLLPFSDIPEGDAYAMYYYDKGKDYYNLTKLQPIRATSQGVYITLRDFTASSMANSSPDFNISQLKILFKNYGVSVYSCPSQFVTTVDDPNSNKKTQTKDIFMPNDLCLIVPMQN